MSVGSETDRTVESLSVEALDLLRDLIGTPSFSGEEGATAAKIESFLLAHGCATQRVGNNVWSLDDTVDAPRRTILLCSHHDTVRPVHGWKRNPFDPVEEHGALYGLGSNDAGASLVTLLAAYLVARERDFASRYVFAACAEEETAGEHGMAALLPHLGTVDMAIVGEPSGMRMATAEKGLLVLDCAATGRAGHAARRTGMNAIDVAMHDIAWMHGFDDPRPSPSLGPLLMTVTQIAAGTQHNVVPDRCTFVADVRVTDVYTHEEVLALIRAHVASEVTPRSMRLRSSAIPADHPLVRAAHALGIECYGSPTISDQALLPAPSVKIGPGRSERSHTADEYIRIDEIRSGIGLMVRLLERLEEELR